MPTTLDARKDPPKSEFRLTGRHVLFILVGCFGIVFAVNGLMVWKAVGSFPGLVTESSFRDSQRFNAEIAAAEAQAARGWRVEATTSRTADGTATVVLAARDRDGRPLSGVAFHARLEHPADRHRDHVLTLAPVAGSSDRFEGKVAGVSPGKWGLVIEGDAAAGRLYLSQNTVYFE